MGRKKIKIAKISNARNRHVTFVKRKAGLLKKAMELSVLCDCEVALLIINKQGQVAKYSSDAMSGILDKAGCANQEDSEHFSNKDYNRLFRDVPKTAPAETPTERRNRSNQVQNRTRLSQSQETVSSTEDSLSQELSHAFGMEASLESSISGQEHLSFKFPNMDTSSVFSKSLPEDASFYYARAQRDAVFANKGSRTGKEETFHQEEETEMNAEDLFKRIHTEGDMFCYGEDFEFKRNFSFKDENPPPEEPGIEF